MTLKNGRQVPKRQAARKQVVKENDEPEREENSKPEVEGNNEPEHEAEHEEGEYEEDLVGVNPIVVKGGRNQYTPWSFMDMVGLASRLPDLTEGAGKWITALEESTGGIRLALGDMKSLLMHVVGKHVTDDVFQKTGLSHLNGGHRAVYVGFNGFRNKVWVELRRLYLDKLDPSKLEGEELKEGERTTGRDSDTPEDFRAIHPGEWVYTKTFKRKWNEARCKGPFKVVLTTPTALKVAGKSVYLC
ncbi:hypothetical protein AAFF_G00142110 [Aldrovandia affinis]|uniref:Murine leukemia virus integrase C-terminal domain-containing protein n=1 Tax=Aldrovandia affinis TaxID=143900 RepID=A0AAD7WXK4_9TELE|nr:hypothetical protein AAFF_G00142110 [Aldrovandia affinis]